MPREARPIWVGLGLSFICTVFFAADVFGDLVLGRDFPGGSTHMVLEFIVVAISSAALVFNIRELSLFFREHRQLKDQIKIAGGEFAEVIERMFKDWSLTPSEADVALLLVKGLSFKDIATARNSAEGTVKAHSSAVYRKAGVSGRHELVSLFLDEFLQNAQQDS